MGQELYEVGNREEDLSDLDEHVKGVITREKPRDKRKAIQERGLSALLKGKHGKVSVTPKFPRKKMTVKLSTTKLLKDFQVLGSIHKRPLCQSNTGPDHQACPRGGQLFFQTEYNIFLSRKKKKKEFVKSRDGLSSQGLLRKPTVVGRVPAAVVTGTVPVLSLCDPRNQSKQQVASKNSSSFSTEQGCVPKLIGVDKC